MKLENVQEFVRSFPSIESLHHTHLWSLDGEHHIFTGHLVVHQDVQIQDLALLRQEIKEGLQQHFHITEATLEIEWPGQQCWDPEHKA
jgi:cobalt-zinc-cadmium efflux system protein